jgi:hypothetical protein
MSFIVGVGYSLCHSVICEATMSVMHDLFPIMGDCIFIVILYVFQLFELSPPVIMLTV